MAEQFKCPRCGFEQPPAEICRKCGINIQRYIEIKKSRNIIPSKNARKRFEEAKQHPGEKPSSEESQKSSSGPSPQEKAAPPKPPDISITEKDRVETTGELSRIVPFMMIFTYLVYEDLKSVKGEVAYPSSAQEKLKWIGAGALGYILLIILIIAFMGAYLTSSLFLLKGII